jgi:hypothetical protein
VPKYIAKVAFVERSDVSRHGGLKYVSDAAHFQTFLLLLAGVWLL